MKFQEVYGKLKEVVFSYLNEKKVKALMLNCEGIFILYGDIHIKCFVYEDFEENEENETIEHGFTMIGHYRSYIEKRRLENVSNINSIDTYMSFDYNDRNDIENLSDVIKVRRNQDKFESDLKEILILLHICDEMIED